MSNKILIGSPIHQKPNILRKFLKSLSNLYKEGLEIHYLFVEDNELSESALILKDFSREENNVTIHINDNNNIDKYECNETTHIWKENLIWKVANFKNMMIEIANEFEFDYLFLVDSDLVLHPKTLVQLLNSNKDIISNIFWTQWQPGYPLLPQVWMFDQYEQYKKGREEQLTNEQIIVRHQQFIEMLKNPGVYEVGGLGACTLISKNAIKKGVNFKEIKNLSFSGEDRHFCIRAQALGFDLFVDTYYPAFHIYREEDLCKISNILEVEKREDFVIKVVQKGIEGLGTYDYKTGYAINFAEYFTEGMLEKLKVDIEAENQINIDNQLVVEAKVSNISMVSKEINNIQVRFNLQNKGTEKGIPFLDEFLCEVSLAVDIARSNWKIDNFTILSQIETFKSEVKRNNKRSLTLSMVIKNEGDRYLKRVLSECREYIDKAVIIDDGSTDDSVSICYEMLKGIPLKLIQNDKSKFSNEIVLRKQQWEETIKTNPDWILNIDADHIFEERFKEKVQNLITQDYVDVYMFRLYDMWDSENYRDDDYWHAHFTYRPFLIRYRSEMVYKWKETPLHCGSFPENILALPYTKSSLRLKHYGWAKKEDRIIKYKRYKTLDPNAQYGWKEQYESILDESPNLVKWEE